MVHEHVRNARKDDIEETYHGNSFVEVRKLAHYLPPCQRDANAFGQGKFVVRHDDPLEARKLPSVEEEVMPYSSCPTPYRWMLEDNFRDICEEENLQIPGRRNPNSLSTWVKEDDRQRALLKHFWEKLTKRKSLVFYYCNRGNAVDDEINRLIVGVSRIVEVGDQKYFGRHPEHRGNFPVWSRQITNGFPTEGVRIPYQEYLALGKDTEGIMCRPPQGLILPFSYVAEHLTDGQAVSTILAIIKSIERVRQDKFVLGGWDNAIDWCNTVLDEVWSGRGAYPGIGSVLRYLGCAQGHVYHATVLHELEKKRRDPWEYVLKILQGRVDPPSDQFRTGLLTAAAKWRSLPSRQKLLMLLTRFELSTDQVSGIANEDLREKRGILANITNILENPYLIYEQDKGSADSEPVDLETIDQGMWPEGDAALFRTVQPITHDDPKRVRATAHAVLREAGTAGDTLLPFDAFIKRVHEYFPDRRRCLVDREAFWEGEDRSHYEKILWLNEELYPESWKIGDASTSAEAEIVDDDLVEDLGIDSEDSSDTPKIKLVALKSIRQQEVAIARVVQRVGPVRDLPPAQPDWNALLTLPVKEGGFGKPKSARETDAITEKIAALEVLFSQRISILTGSAGTGKTSLLKVFLQHLREVEGFTATLLAAPTGKARVRLQAMTNRPANTIHQVLNDVGMLGPNFRILDQPESRMSYKNIVIDESSMPSVELLAALFRAVDLNAFRRLIFVGDPYQLPPIGPGRPFVDILRWMREEHPECIAELKTCMRVTQSKSGQITFSKGLELANGYRDESGPADDAVLSELVQAGSLADVEIVFWKDHADLLKKIDGVFKTQFGIHGDDQDAFDRSLGIDEEDWQKCENWQILSPTRIQAFGSDELNRIIQARFRAKMLSQARDPRSRWPSPMGDQEIVFNDKVMQNENRPKWLPKDSEGLRFVANGEIGIVTEAWKGKDDKIDNLRVVFSTQPEAEYSYKKSEVKEVLELAYALTVHKAQGSDFETVVLIIPRKAQTLSRELLYTGLTRFKGKLVLLLEKDSQPLINYRRPEASDTMRRTTRMFKLLIGQDAGDIGIAGAYRPEGLIHRTKDGTAVRSKSEIIVYDVLVSEGLSVKYELPLIGKDGNPKNFRLPDFTIYHEGRVWFWEHLGLLEKAKYKEDWKLKEAWYRDNGYWDRVLTSQDHPGGIGGVVYADEIRERARSQILKVKR